MTASALIQRHLLSSLRMVAGGEKTHPIVIDSGVVKEWIGFGWIDLREATDDDRTTYPEVLG